MVIRSAPKLQNQQPIVYSEYKIKSGKVVFRLSYRHRSRQTPSIVVQFKADIVQAETLHRDAVQAVGR